MISVTEGGQTTTYTYDANGNRASQTTDGVTTTYTYNNANLVTGMVNKMGDVVISSFTYTYYADGNMYTKAETQLDVTTNTTYVYDGMGRLKSETVGEDVISYYYDANGNRTLMNNDGNITSYTYDKNNRLLTESANGETITYTYDANGNTLTAGNKTYTYNARGQQIGYTDGTVTATYAYNPSGLRSAKTVGGSTKYFVYNGMQIVFEYEDSVSDGTIYYYGLNRTHSSDGDVYVYNAHGDTVQLVNGTSVAASYTYDAFGNLINTIGDSDNAFLYCSEYFDGETETYYLRARYYNPANGRFTQQDAWAFMDPADPLTLNLYTYCFSNPVAYVDFTGNWPTWGQIFTAAAIVTVGVVLAAATIASAGTVGAVAGAAAAVYFGASATTAAAVATTATVATVAVGAGVGLTHLSDAGEVLTGHNVIRDDLMGGNQQLYDDTRALLHIGSAGATYIGSTYGNSFSVPKSNEKQSSPQSKSTTNWACFVAGTLVSTIEGNKFIETIQPGEQVWAADPVTGEVELKSVVRTFINESEELVHVHVAGEEIITTPNHPFWVPEKGWTSAIQLRAGDILVLLNGEYVVVEKIQHEILESPITVYNFEVEDYHTYFVGNSSVFVHNTCSDTTHMSNQEKNIIMQNIARDQAPKFRSREQAEAFIRKYYPNFQQETAGHRSAQGWHFDSHEINGVVTDHINIYSKELGINAHIFWEN